MLSSKKIEISQLIWKTVARAYPTFLNARYSPNSKYPPKQAPSQLVYILKNNAWIPTKDGTFKKPNTVLRNELADGFVYDNRNGWLDAIGFEAEVRETASQMRQQEHQRNQFIEQGALCGIDRDTLEEITQMTPEERKEFVQEQKRKKAEKAISKKSNESKNFSLNSPPSEQKKDTSEVGSSYENTSNEPAPTLANCSQGSLQSSLQQTRKNQLATARRG